MARDGATFLFAQWLKVQLLHGLKLKFHIHLETHIMKTGLVVQPKDVSHYIIIIDNK